MRILPVTLFAIALAGSVWLSGALVPVQAQPSGEPPLALRWSSTEADLAVNSLAWGDIDRDGDLDLAVGGGSTDNVCAGGAPNRVYLTEAGSLRTEASWSSIESDATCSLAWGDYDGDGDLDLAAGNLGQPNRVYRNDQGVLTSTAVWSANLAETTSSVAWGDLDGDGDLDLVVGNDGQPSRIYRNDGGNLGMAAAWSTPAARNTRDLALGDLDSDGDLDLLLGNNGQPVELYRNQSSAAGLSFEPAWSASIAEPTSSLALGDVNADGLLDLAVGNNNQPSKLYLNVAGAFGGSPAWLSSTAPTLDLAFGDDDGDGDLDLAVGNYSRPNALYRNNAGALDTTPSWTSPEIDRTVSVTWADMDGDGHLDLAVGNNLQPLRVYRSEAPPLDATAAAASTDAQHAESLAWGDYDGDGDLDLAVGINGGASRLYRNEQGVLSRDPVWTSLEQEPTTSIAWGDYNGDGKLDLALGYFCSGASPSCRSARLYRNDGTSLIPGAEWTSNSSEPTYDLAWGDYDGDGDLDLITANVGAPLRLYRNNGQTLSAEPIWSSRRSDLSYSVAWGDYDGDGDLDLAVGNYGQPNLLYRNDRGTLTTDPVWRSFEADVTLDVAWGDLDGDGDLDLVAGNNLQPIRLYENVGGQLRAHAAWSSVDGNYTWSLALGDVDNDGDLDLAVGNGVVPKRIYRNDGGRLSAKATWESAEIEPTLAVAWGDVDGDGDLDLAAANKCDATTGNCRTFRIYRNTRPQPISTAAAPHIRFGAAGPAPNANSASFYAVAQQVVDSSVAITYTLTHPAGLPVQRVVGQFSLDGGDHWLPAVATADTTTTNLMTSAQGRVYSYSWDSARSGVMGQSDNVIFRLRAIPALGTLPNTASGPYLDGSFAATTLPFRIRGSQVRVMQNGNPAAGAIVYRQQKGADQRFFPYTDLAGSPFATDAQGYLQGRGQLSVGDRLVALKPISATEAYTLYLLSAAPSRTGIDADLVTRPGVQTLSVASSRPLLALNLIVALEWDARKDSQYLARLAYDLQRTAELLYDWSDGQITLGEVQIYFNRERWDDAYVRIYASNRVRPNASQGGIVAEETPDPDHPSLSYEPGQVRIGPVWNRYGDPGGVIGDDWARTLAHELGHFALFLDDNYLGLDPDGLLVSVENCVSPMSDPYRDDYSEFATDAVWSGPCLQTLSQQTTSRSDWSTIARFYPGLQPPTPQSANPGPSSLPLAITHLHIHEPGTAAATLDTPAVFLTRDGARLQPSANARAVIYRGDEVIDLGRPTLDQVTIRGAQAGDELCVYDQSAQQAGCEQVTAGDEQLALVPLADWQPDLLITPATSRTLAVSVQNIPSNLTLQARLYLETGATEPLWLDAIGPGRYTATITTAEPAYAGYLRVWTVGETPRREALVDYALGGNPGRRRSRNTPRGESPGRRRSRNAPALSSDGQVILFGDSLQFAEGTFFSLQRVTHIPTPPPWASVVGGAYRLSASDGAPDLRMASLSFGYLGSEVPAGEEAWLRMYHWDEGSATWQRLPTRLNTYQNEAVAQAVGPGIYALMSSFELPLKRVGWNLVSYPIAGSRPVTEALQSIAGSYSAIYGRDENDADDSWKLYAPDMPGWANDLEQLRFGHGYWIAATSVITWQLKGAGESPMLAAAPPPEPPATFYGYVQAQSDRALAPGMVVQAFVGATGCGQTITRAVDGQVGYVLDVPAAAEHPGCGAAGMPVRFMLDGRLLPGQIAWSSGRPLAYTLIDQPRRLYLSFFNNQ